jgi:putative spermidine/putrescine transport system ATP-binding protein
MPGQIVMKLEPAKTEVATEATPDGAGGIGRSTTTGAPVRIGESLAVRGVTHAYAGAPAVSDVGFEVPAGGIAAILGPSGCGKSTMLRIVAGLIRPTKGTVHLGSRNVTAVSARARRIGMVFQNYALFPHMTVRENIGYGLTELNRHERRARVDQLLALVRLESFADRLPRQLSGGQQQRVAVARALAPRPVLLLLDEPFAALDRALRADMQFEFVRLQRELGITTILVTHDQEEAQAVADTLIVMNSGRVEQVGSPAELYDRPGSLFVNTFVGHASILSATVQAEGGVASSLRLDAGDTITFSHGLGFLGGTRVALTVRPEHVVLHAMPVPGAVRARRILSVPQGPLLVHDLVLADGTPLKAVSPRTAGAGAADLPAEFFAVLLADRCRVFPAPSSNP